MLSFFLFNYILTDCIYMLWILPISIVHEPWPCHGVCVQGYFGAMGCLLQLMATHKGEGSDTDGSDSVLAEGSLSDTGSYSSTDLWPQNTRLLSQLLLYSTQSVLVAEITAPVVQDVFSKAWLAKSACLASSIPLARETLFIRHLCSVYLGTKDNRPVKI